MYIKQIIIDGFKSYGKHTVVGPLHPGNNVIVGINGCGKSNFLAAVQFVLSDKFNYLQKNEQQALLHEGVEPRSLTASVEIIFDNSDRRIAIDKNEISLKRVIGTKKDQYILNKTVISRGEVISHLETAGLSKSNPYYIIQQGKINEVATTSESRLMLLKEIAGVQVYEDKRTEADAILKDTEMKINNIEQLLETIEEKLNTLKNETEELQKFQEWDRKLRSIEYVIYNREASDSKEKLESLRTLHAHLKKEQAKLQHIVEDLSNKIKNINHNLKRTQRDAEMAEEEKDNLSKELEKLLAEREAHSIKLDDVGQDITSGTESEKLVNEKLETLKIEIEKTQAELEDIKPKYENAVKEGEEIIRKLESLEQDLQMLYARRGRGAQFETKEERNVWINNELSSIDKQIREKEAYIENLQRRIAENDSERSKLHELQESVMSKLKHEYEAIDKYRKECNDLNKERDQSSAKKKDLRKEEQALLHDLAYLEEDLRKISQDMNARFGKEIFNGINSVNKILKIFSERADMVNQLHKYHGLVVERFTCGSKLYRAVEVTAGARLFYHIVSESKFGEAILKEMNRQGLPGVVSFMPLDRLRTETISYPQFDSHHAVPLLDKLEYNERHAIPMRYLFGKMILCRDLKYATEIAGREKFDCITLEGDQASSKGWLRGGHYATSKSPMKMQQDKTDLIQKMDDIRKKISSLSEEIKKIDNDITINISNSQLVETKRMKAKETYDKLQYDLGNIKEQIRNLERNQVLERKNLQELQSDLSNLQTLRQKLVEELEQELNDHLTEADEIQIRELNESMKKLRKDLKDVFEKKKELEKQKMDHENKLSENLYCKKKELECKLQEIGLEDKKLFLQELQYESSVILEKIKKCKIDLEANEKKHKDANSQRQQKIEELEMLYNNLKPEQEQFEKNCKELESLSSKMRVLEENIEVTKRKMDELGPIASTNLLSRYNNINTKTLYKKQDICRKNLKNFDHVNKKALDQYEILKDQKDNFFKRKEELDRARVKILDLFNFLEQKKFEAVEFTFKQVCKYFSDIFRKIIPRGKAELVMQRGSSQSENGSMSSSSLDVGTLRGIGIRVSFTNQTSAMIDYNQLSGGQKSLVALTLIFAIQKCDPAPFYLFDEIDGDLDADHRRAVAQMIYELSTQAQFIIITHRPELLAQANQFYGVRYQNNKLSSIFEMSREQALEFVEADEEGKEEEI